MPNSNNTDLNRRRLLGSLASATAATAVGTGTATATSNGAKPDRLIVGTRGKRGANAAKNKAKSVHRELDFGDIGRAVAGEFPEQAKKGLKNRPDVRYIEPDLQAAALGESTPWGIDRVDADQAQNAGYTGNGADIAILDTGIDKDHPDLQANLGAGKAFAGSTWDDDNGHGSHCAGTAGAVDNNKDVIGVGNDVTLHAVEVLASDGWGSYSDIAAGIEYTANQGWDVASMSIGGSSSSSTMADAIQYATDNGVLCVAAAGNNGPCTDCVMYPARHPEVVAVSAMTSSDSLASYSCTGPEIDLIAPGSNVNSTVPGGTAYYSGTSMACPHVSGAAGVLMANGYSNTEARDRLLQTAEDVGLGDTDQGSGLLDVESAIGDQNTNMIGEAGTISADENWTTVTLDGSYTDPVVVTSVGTFNDSDPAHSRVRNAGSGSFEVRLEEWEYQDGAHSIETVQYIVVEAGEHNTEAGVPLVAGTATANGSNWTTVSFSPSWEPQSHIYTQMMTNNDPTPVSTRITRTGAGTLDVSCHEEESNVSGSSWVNDHADETVGFIATKPIYRGNNDDPGESIASSIPTDAWTTNEFNRTYSTAPVTVARMQSFFGGNTVDLRMKDFSASSFEVKAQEEQSLNDEVTHVPEYVATLAFESGPISSA
jgi:subtilisin family serine protease